MPAWISFVLIAVRPLISLDSLTTIVRDSNESQGPASRDELREHFGYRRPVSGTDNFGNLLRNPLLLLGELIAEGLAQRGFGDLRPALLSVGQHVRQDGTRITEIAEHASLTKATVVHSVNELERLGYVRRIPDPADGRAKLVILTARGTAAEQAGREVIQEAHAAWTKLLGNEEMQRLEDSLRRLGAALSPR